MLFSKDVVSTPLLKITSPLTKVFHDTTLYGDGTRTNPLRVISAGNSLPDQSGNAGKYLTTNGTSLIWGTPTLAASIYTASGIIASQVVATVTDTFSIKANDVGKIIELGDINNDFSGSNFTLGGTGIKISPGHSIKIGGSFSNTFQPYIEVTKIETNIRQTENDYIRLHRTDISELRISKQYFNISTPFAGVFKGLMYELDYSANFGPRSLVDKEYVDRVSSDIKQTVNPTINTQTVNFDFGNIVELNISTVSDLTLVFVTASVGTYVIKINNNLGALNINWPTNVKWSGGVPPQITQVTGKSDIITLVYDGNNYYGTYALNF